MKGICIVCREVALPPQPSGRPRIYCGDCKKTYHREYVRLSRGRAAGLEALERLIRSSQGLPWLPTLQRARKELQGASLPALTRAHFRLVP